MISLFLDTSSDNLSVFLVKENDILYKKSITTKNDHSSYIITIIRDSLEKNNLNIKDINKIFVTVGPGSFTGTRIGITVAKTIAWALKLNVVPISSLKQYIFNYSNYKYYIPILEDKRGLYYGIYDENYNEVEKEKYIVKEEFNNKLSKYDNYILIKDDMKKINIIKLIEYYKNDEGINPHKLVPNYVKKIEAESKL